MGSSWEIKGRGKGEAGGSRYLEGCFVSREKQPGEAPAWLRVWSGGSLTWL